MTWKIQAISGEFTGQEISIDRDMLVGRHQSADLVLQSAEISRKHAAFLLKEQVLYVQDLNSSNGTFVNDLRIADETLLKEGDIVQFASLSFQYLRLRLNWSMRLILLKLQKKSQHKQKKHLHSK